MAKLPPRRVLRSIVEDAINDREEFDDCACERQTSEIIARYREFLPRLADGAPALGEADLQLMAYACMHARIWREGYLDSWKGTGDKAVILSARQDVERVTRTEEAMGVVRHWTRGGPLPDDVRDVPLTELMKRPSTDGEWIGGEGWFDISAVT